MNRSDRRRAQAAQKRPSPTTEEAIISAVDFLLERGATNVVITEAEDGSITVSGDTVNSPTETTTHVLGDTVVTIGPNS